MSCFEALRQPRIRLSSSAKAGDPDAAASRFMTGASGILDRPVKPDDDSGVGGDDSCGLERHPSHTFGCHPPRKRGIQYAAAPRFMTGASGILDRPVKPGDDSGVGGDDSCGLERHPSHTFGCHPPRKRGIQYAAASRFMTGASGILDRPVKPDDDSGVGGDDSCGLERHASRIFHCHPPRKRGIQYAAACRFMTGASGILDRPVEPDDDSWGRVS